MVILERTVPQNKPLKIPQALLDVIKKFLALNQCKKFQIYSSRSRLQELPMKLYEII